MFAEERAGTVVEPGGSAQRRQFDRASLEQGLAQVVSTHFQGDAGRAAAHSVDVYLSSSLLLRRFFWLRLDYLARLTDSLIRDGQIGTRMALDLGGGNGLLSAMMASRFDGIALVDLDTWFARCLLAQVGVMNVDLVEKDALTWWPRERFDVVFAADVLEHFPEPEHALRRIRGWLRPGGVLITSLPTENLFYQALRVPFGKRRPADHYHGAVEVEREIVNFGFQPLKRIFHPLVLPVLPLFHIAAWSRD